MVSCQSAHSLFPVPAAVAACRSLSRAARPRRVAVAAPRQRRRCRAGHSCELASGTQDAKCLERRNHIKTEAC
ncbi:hypothetical protein RC1_3722 [Rhodospirillum centenum SW]|uniref:Uncharacterized protein n=1 Tax=Rhodospirillum centenum (strain ATCC 51521 / SW) TaxID=414684 RepID=B6IXP1_RHOCS|nr:hypothetical protein RC1_3722 [Rhodospirillum centenum SW]